MANFRCKICGGMIVIKDDQTTAVCEYCGNRQTLPRLNNNEKSVLVERAEMYRQSGDYDKAIELYEKTLSIEKSDPDVYWALALCRYGILFVRDPRTGMAVPTVNRTQMTPISLDKDYKTALEYADFQQRSLYEEQAKRIDEIQKNILKISKNEQPFDVFICYKENDSNGRRTHESANVSLLKTMPAPLPPSTMLISPQGTKKDATGSTIRFANKK